MAPSSGLTGSTVAFIDLGTYSVRMMIVRFNPNRSFTIVSEQKESVRLGGDEFEEHRLQPDAMQRTLEVCSRFAEMARRFNAREISAVATSATREAENQRKFLRLLRDEAGIDVRVVSGKEEARLVYLGVSRALNLAGRTAFFIDIGGGSTELAVGDEKDFQYLDSLKLGAIRVTQMFGLDRELKPIKASQYAAVCDYVRNAAVRTVQQLAALRWDLVVASSGTSRNLAGIAAAAAGRSDVSREPTLTRAELRRVAKLLCETPLRERPNIPGLNPERSDIIVAGAAILETLMDDLKIESLQTSQRGVRDGLLVDYLAERHGDDPIYSLSARRRSVLLLGRRCGFDEGHAQAVARLALQLFDSAREAGLHEFGDAERELLEYAGLLHDIGVFLSFVNHQAHTYYLVRHADLLGFDQTEIAIMAALARYHRKGTPRKKHAEFAELDEIGQNVVGGLYIYLRLAERLERSHRGVVRQATLRRNGAGLELELAAAGDCMLEVWAVEKDLKSITRAMGRDVAVLVTEAGAAAAATTG